jgi:hypothetical protein
MGVEGMKKGFAFTLDAFLAITLVILTASALLFYFNSIETKSIQIESIKGEASDAGIVGFYTNKSPEELGFESSASNWQLFSFGFCFEYFNYNPSENLEAQSEPEKTSFCRVSE